MPSINNSWSLNSSLANLNHSFNLHHSNLSFFDFSNVLSELRNSSFSSAHSSFNSSTTSNNLNNFNLFVLSFLLDLHVFDNTINSLLSKFIYLINFIRNNIEPITYFPETIHLFKKFFRIGFTKYFSFVAKCCEIKIFNFKSLDEIICIGCDKKYSIRRILSKKNYFFRFMLREQYAYR